MEGDTSERGLSGAWRSRHRSDVSPIDRSNESAIARRRSTARLACPQGDAWPFAPAPGKATGPPPIPPRSRHGLRPPAPGRRDHFDRVAGMSSRRDLCTYRCKPSLQRACDNIFAIEAALLRNKEAALRRLPWCHLVQHQLDEAACTSEYWKVTWLGRMPFKLVSPKLWSIAYTLPALSVILPTTFISITRVPLTWPFQP
jgi:hypothetical protein